MQFASFSATAHEPLVATAVHNGHELRPDLAALIRLDESTRLREEDPHTGSLASRFDVSVVVHRSRFEIDLNRSRDEAVYRDPEDAWGLDVWTRPLTEQEVSASVQLHDAFYDRLSRLLEGLIAEFGGFVLYDIHSYNHRRSGPDGEPDPPAENPTVNLGTGSLPARWTPVAVAFVESMRRSTLDGSSLDVRENIRFKGRHVAHWVHDKYGDTSCALAIELKKVFMDEWTGRVDVDQLRQIGDALEASMAPVRRAWELA